jgi:hypothetical protein
MKKILAIALVLCLFTAFAVGTAAAKPVTMKASGVQLQGAYASGPCASASSVQALGVVSFKKCDTKILAAGGAQAGYASTKYGTAVVVNAQAVRASICA